MSEFIQIAEKDKFDTREKIVSDVDLIRLPNGDVKAVLEEVEPQDEQDSREKLESDVREFANVYYTSNLLVYDKVIELLDRQAAITRAERTCTMTNGFHCSECGKLLGSVRNCEMYETVDGRQAWRSLDREVCDHGNYCPNCGARIEVIPKRIYTNRRKG